jgi:Transposase DDE domain
MRTRVEKVAALAMKLGTEHLADYGSIKSRHDFTQRQLMACLILKTYLKCTYRGVVDVLGGHTALRKALGMEEKLPHYTTLQKFHGRAEVSAIVDVMIGRLGRAALQQAGPKAEVAMDATGMEPGVASAHFTSRSGRKRSRYVKLSLVVVCGSLLPLGLVTDWGPNNDKCQAAELLDKSLAAAGEHPPQRLLADAGYDADWIHRLCRECWGVESLIKAVVHRKDGLLGGTWRRKMTPRRLKRQGYGRRWHIESFISGLKRCCGSALGARTHANLHHEAALRVLTYAIHR